MKKPLVLVLLLAFLLPVSASASVAVNGERAALVSEDGRSVVPPGVYAVIVPLDDCGLFAAMDESGLFGLIGGDGSPKTVMEYTYFEFADGVILYEKDGKYGAMDANLTPLVPCEYTWLVPNGNGGFLAHTTDVWDDYPDGVYRIDETGYVSPTGVKVASLLTGFHGGLSPALSTDKGRYGYLNPEGQWALRPQYAYAEPFEDGCAVAALDSGSGLIDPNGTWKISPKYDAVARMRGENKIVCVSYTREIDVYSAETFELTLNLPLAEGAYVTVGDHALIVYDAEHVSAIQPDGTIILSVAPDSLLIPASENRLIVFEGGWAQESACLVDWSGKQTSDAFKSIRYLGPRRGGECYVTNEFEDSKNGEWDYDGVRCGAIDENGREILPMTYTAVSMPAEGWILAESDERMELYGPDGQLVWSCAL